MHGSLGRHHNTLKQVRLLVPAYWRKLPRNATNYVHSWPPGQRTHSDTCQLRGSPPPGDDWVRGHVCGKPIVRLIHYFIYWKLLGQFTATRLRVCSFDMESSDIWYENPLLFAYVSLLCIFLLGIEIIYPNLYVWFCNTDVLELSY